MFRPIPSKILKHAVTLEVCSGIDAWQRKTYDAIHIRKVVVQPTHQTLRQAENTQVDMQAICFIDARRSIPTGIDFVALQETSEKNGDALRLKFNNRSFQVLNVDVLYDDEGIYHHTELGLA